MHAVAVFSLVLALLAVVTALHWLAGKLRWPPSAALIVGGGALAFLPGVPQVTLDPELVLVLFLPPLLVDGAWHTELVRFRRHLPGILSLAVGAVVFSTLVVAVIAHVLLPGLPWAACAALGAIVSPPDAVSAKTVLAQVKLPRRINALLEGESLLNDATGLVILRFSVAVIAGESAGIGAGLGRFGILVIGGAAVGLIIGQVWTYVAKRLKDELVIIVTTSLVGWGAYIVGEALHVSGVIAAVSAGLVLGWRQHVVFSASTRIRATSFWEVLVFLLEALVFILIGLSLRGVLAHADGRAFVSGALAAPILSVIAGLTLARFAWMFASTAIVGLAGRLGVTRARPIGFGGTVVMGWAGMRGVVTLAAALTLPATFPGRDFILLCAFGVILVTVLLQGTTLGALIRLLGVTRSADDAPPLDIYQAETAVMKAQLAAVERLARDKSGELVHPQLLQRYTLRAGVRDRYAGDAAERDVAIESHFDVILGAAAAGRAELLHLHKEHQIDDEILVSLEHDLDLEELGAAAAKA